MRVLLAFVLGAVIAAGVVLFVVKRQGAPPPQAPEVAAAVPAAAPSEPALPPPEPAPAAEPVRPAKSTPARVLRTNLRPPAARLQPAAVEPASSTPAPPPPAAAPAPPQPVEPAPAAAQQEPLPAPPPPPPEPKSVTLTAGTLLTVRLLEALSSDRAQAGDSFSATLDQPLVVEGFVIAERGARVLGKVISADKAGRVKGLAQLSIQLTQINTSDGQKIPILTEAFVREGQKSVGGDAAKVGVAAGIGAAIGAIAGGGRGAAIGAGVGGAAGTGGVMATRGKAAVLPVETRLSFRLKDPVTVTEKAQ